MDLAAHGSPDYYRLAIAGTMTLRDRRDALDEKQVRETVQRLQVELHPVVAARR
jgi:hypothetical protein